MEKCLKSEVGGEIMVRNGFFPEREGILKRELEHVQEKGIVGSAVEPTQVYMDDVDRLDHSFYSGGLLGSEEERALPEETSFSKVRAEIQVPDIKLSMILEKINGVLEGNSSAIETVISNEPLLTDAMTGCENLEDMGDVPGGDKVVTIDEKSFDENKELGTETVSYSSNEETIKVDANKVSILENGLADTVGEIPLPEDEKKSSDFSLEDENMEPVLEVFAEDGQSVEVDSKPSEDCADYLEEATVMEEKEVLNYEMVQDDNFCDKILGESQDFADETQVLAIREAIEENGKETMTSDTKSEIDGDKLLHKDEKQMKAVFIEDAEQVGVNGRLDPSIIDSHESVQVQKDNAFHEISCNLENVIESKIGIRGETLVDDPSTHVDSSTVEDQRTNPGDVSESIAPSVDPSEIKPEILETQTASQSSPTVGPSETEPQNLKNLEDCMIVSDLHSAAHMSDKVVVTEYINESDEAVEQNSHGRVLNRCRNESLVVELDVCMDKDKELLKDDIGLEEVESHMMTDAEFSEYFDGSANANGEICLEAKVEKKYNLEDQDIEMSEQIIEPEQANGIEVKVSKESTLRPRAQVDLANHLLPEESEAEFSVSDLVWGKVKSHPWWPGQIYDPEDASEKAMQHHKKDSYLVAYFGDRTFAWNEASVLKPFWSNFSHIVKQSSSEVFQNAINSALDEVSRRIMLGLACSCIPNDIYSNFECQIVENTGIRLELSRSYDVDESTRASTFRPNKLVEYMRALAESPSAGTDRLGLVIAKAQLLAFNQTRGRYLLPEIQYCGGLLESDDVDNSILDQANECTPHENSNKKKLEPKDRTSNKRKHNLKDGSYSSKREKRLSEIMGDGGSAEQNKKISFYAAKVSSITGPPVPKPSFKVGDCIRKAASQLTGSLSILKNGHNEKSQKVDGIVDDLQTPPANTETCTVKDSSVEEMFLQLQMLARDPVKGHGFGNSIPAFFSSFRGSVNLSQFVGRHGSVTEKSGGGKKRRVSQAFAGSPEEFEFDDVSDSYWTDMIIQNHSEEQTGSVPKRGRYKIVTLDAGKLHKSSQPRGNSRKRFSTGNHQEMAVGEPISYVDQMRQANLPTELILNFSEADSVPNERHLIKTFRRFGPLKENEIEVDLETSRARVVFKRCSDAEVAYSSAGKFSLFSPVFVNYQLNYTPSISFSYFSRATSEGLEDAV